MEATCLMHVGELGRAETSASGASMLGRPARDESRGRGVMGCCPRTWQFVLHVPSLVLSTFDRQKVLVIITASFKKIFQEAESRVRGVMGCCPSLKLATLDHCVSIPDDDYYRGLNYD